LLKGETTFPFGKKLELPPPFVKGD
jgi:hypothetical protein